MHGPSHALSFTAIITYGNIITPTGTLGTVQGLVQGVNEDLGIIPYSTYIQVLFFCKKLNNL